MNKKALLTVSLLSAAIANGFSQGLLTFENVNSTQTIANPVVKNPYTGNAADNGSGSYTDAHIVSLQLFYADASVAAPAALTSAVLGSSQFGGWKAVTTSGPIQPGDAFLSGGFSDAVSTGSDIAKGGNVWLEAVAWTDGGATVSASGAAKYFGASSIWSQATGGGGTPASLPVSTYTKFTGVTLTPVPEPTTIALAGLGAASLLLFRRRK